MALTWQWYENITNIFNGINCYVFALDATRSNIRQTKQHISSQTAICWRLTNCCRRRILLIGFFDFVQIPLNVIKIRIKKLKLLSLVLRKIPQKVESDGVNPTSIWQVSPFFCVNFHQSGSTNPNYVVGNQEKTLSDPWQSEQWP